MQGGRTTFALKGGIARKGRAPPNISEGPHGTLGSKRAQVTCRDRQEEGTWKGSGKVLNTDSSFTV